MNDHIKGIHHITALAGDAQRNLDFYVGILGLRLVKRTVNFDAPDTYHFYYGDESGNPGTIITFFPWGGNAWRGRPGTGQVTIISFSIPENAIGFWKDRLTEHHISYQKPFTRFDEKVITFRDPDGIQLELVAGENSPEIKSEDMTIRPETAIRGIHSTTLALKDYEKTCELLSENFNFQLIKESGNRKRFYSGNKQMGSVIDLLHLPNVDNGRVGIGSVHHIAWRVADNSAQKQKREELIERGYQVSSVMDRNYFYSIYFREMGNVLFEIATDSPGFLIDESKEELGLNLKLPEWLEPKRSKIEASLPEINIPDINLDNGKK